MNQTEESFGALNSQITTTALSKEAKDTIAFIRSRQTVKIIKPAKYTRQQMLDKLARLPEMDLAIDEAENKALDNSIYATFTADDLEALREGRRKMITGVSDKSVEGYEEMSRVLHNLINVLDAYSKYRTH